MRRQLFGALLFFFLFPRRSSSFCLKVIAVANKCLFCPLLFLPFMPASLFLPLFHGGEGPVAEKYPFGALVFLPCLRAATTLRGEVSRSRPTPVFWLLSDIRRPNGSIEGEIAA